MAEKNEVVVSFSEALTDKLISVESALPADFNRTRFVQNCLALMNEHPELAKVNKNAVIQGLLKGGFLGLDYANKECYLIPYGNTVNFQTDYKGECKFVKRYAIRPIKDIYAKVVRTGDEFVEKIVNGLPTIDFKPLPFNGNEIIGAFAVVLYKDGGIDYETMSTDAIQSVRNNYSKASNSKAWKASFDEMAKKTVLRRLCKHIEIDFDSVNARSAWEEGSGMDFTSGQNVANRDEVVDVFGHQEDMQEAPQEDTVNVEDVIDAEAREVFG